jgi:hypothetical protein
LIGQLRINYPKSNNRFINRADLQIERAVMTALESGPIFKAAYDMSKVLAPLSEWLCEGGVGSFGKLMGDADTARPHKAAVSEQSAARNGIVIAAHSPYSPDLAPSDFYLLGHVKALFRAFWSPSKTGI